MNRLVVTITALVTLIPPAANAQTLRERLKQAANVAAQGVAQAQAAAGSVAAGSSEDVDPALVRYADAGTAAGEFANRPGQDFAFRCLPGGEMHHVWGTDIYAVDSSICTAAVHAGRINLRDGGVVVLQIRPGQSSYRGTSRRGVTSDEYGHFNASYVFVPAPTSMRPKAETIRPADIIDSTQIRHADPSTGGGSFANRLDQDFTFRCASQGEVSRIYGTGVYTVDSSICTAAVHAGVITLLEGGVVTIRIRPGQLSYIPSQQNGITSSGYGEYHGSFIFLTPRITAPADPMRHLAVPASVRANPTAISWHTGAGSYTNRKGQFFAFRCPGDGEVGRIHGTDVYTVDSSICTAAAHAGKITPRSGGVVVIQVLGGQLSYERSQRNAITSNAYGEYHGSFVIR